MGCNEPKVNLTRCYYLNGRRCGKAHFVNRTQQRTWETQLIERANRYLLRWFRFFFEKFLTRRDIRWLLIHAFDGPNNIFCLSLCFQIMFFILRALIFLVLLLLCVITRVRMYLTTTQVLLSLFANELIHFAYSRVLVPMQVTFWEWEQQNRWILVWVSSSSFSSSESSASNTKSLLKFTFFASCI